MGRDGRDLPTYAYTPTATATKFGTLTYEGWLSYAVHPKVRSAMPSIPSPATFLKPLQTSISLTCNYQIEQDNWQGRGVCVGNQPRSATQGGGVPALPNLVKPQHKATKFCKVTKPGKGPPRPPPQKKKT